MVTATYNLVFKTGMFANDCKMWCRRDPSDKTWPHFKTYFTVAHQKLRKSQQTSQGVGYHSANNATMEDLHQDIQQETVDTIANLATATAADQATVKTLTATNSLLSKEIISVNQKLVKLMEENKHLRSKSTGWGRGGDREGHKTKGPFYCFFCGSGVWHRSRTCWRKKPGHKDDATEDKKIGGSTAIFKSE